MMSVLSDGCLPSRQRPCGRAGASVSQRSVAGADRPPRDCKTPMPTQPLPMDFQQRFDEAAALHGQGRVEDAIARYRALLEERPNEVNVLVNLATALKQVGRNEEALTCFRRGLGAEPTRLELWFNLANLLCKMRQVEEAERSYRRAIELDSDFFQAHLNLANLLRDRERFEEAECEYREAIRIKPDLALASGNLAAMLVRHGRAADAIAVYREALRIVPDSVASLRALARLLYEKRELEDSARLYRAAISREPGHADDLNSLGVVLKELGQGADALKCWEQAARIAPRHADAHNNLGVMYRMLRQSQRAIEHLREALRLGPDDATSAANLSHALLEFGQVSEATEVARTVVEKHPDNADGHLMLGFALVQRAQIEEAISQFIDAHQAAPASPGPISNALFASLYSNQRSAAGILALHRELVAKLPKGGGSQLREKGKKKGRRLTERALRVGYVSPNLRSHPVAYFFEPILSHHDRSQVEAICYSTSEASDGVTARLRPHAALWRECASWSDDRLAAQIRSDEIDILVDLAGHTAEGRVQLFQRKPAPVQVLYIGYPCTTGLAEMDWIIADDRVCPPGFERFYAERVMRLDGSFWCYQPREHSPAVGPLPARANGFVTFGSFNTLPKISPTTIALWVRVLEAVPDSRLILKALAFADEATREIFQRRFAAAGIETRRVVIEPPTMEHGNFLSEYNRLDIALDPVPYNGGTTSCEALWMGVPVVTLPGEHFFSRMTLSFLHNLGLADLAAPSLDDYVRIAAELAGDLSRLESLRMTLRSRMAASPICDATRAVHELELAYRAM